MYLAVFMSSFPLRVERIESLFPLIVAPFLLIPRTALSCRCKNVPLVCHAWLQAHRDYPPQRKVWCIKSFRLQTPIVPGISRAMVSWFLKIANNLEELEVHLQTSNQKVPCVAQHRHKKILKSISAFCNSSILAACSASGNRTVLSDWTVLC